MKHKKSKKSNKNFRIVRIERELVKDGLFKKPVVKTKKVEVIRFHANDVKEAYDFLKDYTKTANKDYTYYFDEINVFHIMNDDGSVTECEDIVRYWDSEDKNHPFIVRMWKSLTYNLWYWFIDKPNSVKHWVKDIAYLLRTKHNRNESWSLDTHMLDDMLWNIPILIKSKHGLAAPFLDMAVKETHKDDSTFNLDEWNKTYHDYTKEEEELADKYQRESYEKVVEFIKLYYYYESYGVVDKNNEDEVAFDKKFRSTLPIIPGSYDMMDYKRLSELQKKTWNKIWEWVRTYGQTLWD